MGYRILHFLAEGLICSSQIDTYLSPIPMSFRSFLTCTDPEFENLLWRLVSDIMEQLQAVL